MMIFHWRSWKWWTHFALFQEISLLSLASFCQSRAALCHPWEWLCLWPLLHDAVYAKLVSMDKPKVIFFIYLFIFVIYLILCFCFLSLHFINHYPGTAFALLSIVSSLGMVMSPLLLDAVYAKTVSMDKPQLTFYIAAAIYVIPMTLTW